MTDKLTRIKIPGQRSGWGLMDWGKKSPAEMVAQMRSYAEELRAHAAAIDATRDEDFCIQIVLGSAKQAVSETIQEGRAKDQPHD